MKNLPKGFFVLLGIFLLLRVVNLNFLPPFNDESIYVNWGQIMVNQNNMGFYSLFDGKQPLLMWLFGLSGKLISDPFLAAKLVSVVFSLFTFFGIFLVSKKILKYPFSLFPLIIYSVTPLFLFFDRQALMESALCTINIFALFFIRDFIKKSDYKLVIFLALTLGTGLFIKSTGLIFLFLSVFVFIYLFFKNQNRKKIVISSLLLLFLVFIILLPLILQPNFRVIFDRGDRYNLTLSELTSFPFSIWLKNIRSFLEISFWQLTPPLFLAAVFGLFLLFRKKEFLIIFWFLGTVFIAVFSGRGISPRYIVSLLPLTTIFSGLLFAEILGKKILGKIFSLILLLFPVFISLKLIFTPLDYFNLMDKLTKDYSQKTDYITGDTSGYGLIEVKNYLDKKAENGPLVVGVRLDAGNPENAILAYYYYSQNIKATFFDRQLFDASFDFTKLNIPIPLYFVSRSQHQGGLENYLIEEKRFYKPEGKSYFAVLKFDPQKTN